VTEVERAEQVAREPRRRFKQNIALVAAGMVALALFLVLWHETQTRAETAETSAASLAEQVQQACESQGSLDLDGRDLCKQAAEVVANTPVAGPAGAQGIPGPQGERGFTGATGPQGRTGPPGETGPRGPIGPRGAPGEPGDIGLTGTAGATGEQGPIGLTGPQGIQGIQGPKGDTGAKGDTGDRGPQGAAKPGTYACPDGETVVGFTIAADGAVTLSCRAPTPPVIEPPAPSPTPTP
jgi:hypothetical protein